MNFGKSSSMTGSEPSISEQLSKVVVLDDASNTSTTQEASLSSSSSTSSSICTNTSRDHLHHDDNDDLWRRQGQRQRLRGRNNSWDTTLSGTTMGSRSSEHSTTTTTTTSTTTSTTIPIGCQLVDDYLSRRDKRLAALRASRQERLQQSPASITQTVGSSSSSLICIEDHPYYLAQQERKLQELKEQMDHATTTTTSSLSLSASETTTNAKVLPEMTIPTDLLEELTSAYQLIHRQRLYLQHLLQQQDEMQQQHQPPEKVKSSRRSRSTSSSSVGAASRSSSSTDSTTTVTTTTLIQQLQTQLIQLEHDKAEKEFMLCNRITHGAMEYQDRLRYIETKAEYWQMRSRNERESHAEELQKATRRIQELEQALCQQEAKILAPIHPPNPPPLESARVATNDDDLVVVDKNHWTSTSTSSTSQGDFCAHREAVSSPLPLLRQTKISSELPPYGQQQQPSSGYISPSVSQADLIASVMNKKKRLGFFGGYAART